MEAYTSLVGTVVVTARSPHENSFELLFTHRAIGVAVNLHPLNEGFILVRF